MRTDRPLTLAVTLGDPRGIGPEVARAAAASYADRRDVRLLMIGPESAAARDAADEFIAVDAATSDGPAPGAPAAGANRDGQVAAGRVAGRAIEIAAELALAGRADAIVTAPIDKAALRAAGFSFPGHTEMLAALAGVRPVAMLMVAERTALGGALRVVLATTHLPLAGVPRALSMDRLTEQARLAHAALRDEWGIASPRLALCALNPHASDGGLFGDEEARIFVPARERLNAEGIDIEGPIPADTVFVRALRGEFDLVIAPYHDVGMAAFKTAAFGHGVNVTLGLPFVRTSPDHGTARDIAGLGRADPTSMLEAMRLAERLARGRRDSPAGMTTTR